MMQPISLLKTIIVNIRIEVHVLKVNTKKKKKCKINDALGIPPNYKL